MLPSGLMAHFESEKYKNCPLHFGAQAYLLSLYKNYHKGAGHKDQYEVGDVHYKKGEAEVQKNIHTNSEVQSVEKKHKTPVTGKNNNISKKGKNTDTEDDVNYKQGDVKVTNFHKKNQKNQNFV